MVHKKKKLIIEVNYVSPMFRSWGRKFSVETLLPEDKGTWFILKRKNFYKKNTAIKYGKEKAKELNAKFSDKTSSEQRYRKGEYLITKKESLRID
jgi:hypothetical protein